MFGISEAMMKMANSSSVFYANQDMTFPRPVLTGNGELVTCFGPTGYHTESPIPEMQVFCLAGRRLMNLPQGPLVRYGRIKRTLIVNGEISESLTFGQELIPTEGIILSHNDHQLVEEDTTSFVHLNSNSCAFKTTITNKSSEPLSGKLVLTYTFGDWEGRIPEGIRFLMEPRPRGMYMYFTLRNEHLGAEELLCEKEAEFQGKDHSFTATWQFKLDAGQSDSVAFLFGIGDRLRFRHTPRSWSFEEILTDQKLAWHTYQSASKVNLGFREIEALREICLYDIRCNSTPWSIPPCVTPAQWEGRTFHDEFFPFMGLISAGHVRLAEKIPLYRLHTLHKAIERSQFRGAKYAWESFENGEDGSPYGHYLDEHFHMAQFAETAWQLILYTGDLEYPAKFYPLLKEIADYFLLNMIEPDAELLRIKECTDFDETVYPVVNGIYTAAGAIRSLELAARVGREIGESEARVKEWENVAIRLRKNLPRQLSENRYLTASGARHRHIAEAGVVYPFRVDPHSDMAVNTLDTFCTTVMTERGLQPGDAPEYAQRGWLWTNSHISTAYSLSGKPDKAWDILSYAPRATGPGLTPAESVSKEGHLSAPWFTTGAGAYVYAVHSLFVQVLDDGTTRLPDLPAALQEAAYEGLAGANGLIFSAHFKDGEALELTIKSPNERISQILASRRVFPDIIHWNNVVTWREENGFYRLTIQLEKGNNFWKR